MTLHESLAIEVQQLTKRYGDNAAVDSLDLQVFTGEIFALLGPNGAGKSTTVEMLEGFRRPTSGVIKVLGHNPTSVDMAWRDRIGVVSQSGSLEEECTVQELLALTATYYRHPRSVSEAIALVGLQEKTNARVGSLSGGQQRRVDVALGTLVGPNCCSSTSPPPDLIPRHDGSFGISSGSFETKAQPSC